MAGISSPFPLTSPAEADPVLIATKAMDPRETANHLVIFTSCSIRRSGHFPGIPSNVGPNRGTVNCPLSLRLPEIHRTRRCRTACACLSLLARARHGTLPQPSPGRRAWSKVAEPSSQLGTTATETTSRSTPAGAPAGAGQGRGRDPGGRPQRLRLGTGGPGREAKTHRADPAPSLGCETTTSP